MTANTIDNTSTKQKATDGAPRKQRNAITPSLRKPAPSSHTNPDQQTSKDEQQK